MTFWKKQNYEDNKKISFFHGLGEREGSIFGEQSISRTVKIGDTIIMDACHYTFVQTHRLYNTKKDSKLLTFDGNDVSM